MSELRLAGNFINFSGFLKYGHLQIVFVDDDGAQLENEVQSPPSGFFKEGRSLFARPILFVLFGLFLIFSINQSAYSSESIVNRMIDDDFIAWSNSMPKEEAEIQLRDFLSSFNSWDEAKKWLTSKGFNVSMKSRLLSEKAREKYNNHPRVFSNSVSWDNEKLGMIFANSWFLKLEAKIFVYGVGVGIEYVNENGQFNVYRVQVTETRL